MRNKKSTSQRLLVLMASLCFISESSSAAVDAGKMNKFVDHLLSQMTIEEKAGQMNQVTGSLTVTGPSVKGPSREDIAGGRVGSMLNVGGADLTRDLQKIAVEKSRLKIPLVFAWDIIHGYRTIFPIPLAESSSWNLDLMQKTARIAASEGSADGIEWTFAPMVDVARDPRWGRMMEGAGEDPWLGSQIARAKVHGFQGDVPGATDSLLACAKHFVGYGAAIAGRDYNSSQVSERDLLETYFPPFQAAVGAGVATLMPAFSDIGGVPTTSDEELLKRTLREKWKFNGVIVSDYGAIRELVNHGVANDEMDASRLAINASVDIDMEGHDYVKYVAQLVKDKKVSVKDVDASVRKILEMKYKLGLFEDPYRFSDEKRAGQRIFTPENRAVARDMARRSIVLLKNAGGALPLKKSGTVAVIGPFFDNHRDLLGNWAARGDHQQAVSLIDGLKNVAGSRVKFLTAKGSNLINPGPLLNILNNDPNDPEIVVDPRSDDEMIKEAVEVAKKSDVVILALGETQNMSGESTSRTRLRLPENQQILSTALKAVKKPIVLLMYNGRPIVVEKENRDADALVETWYLGTESGNAIADVLFGDYNPSGKLTASFPVNEGQIPVFYNHRATGRPFDAKDWYTTKYLDAPNEPLFPFGYGLSYTAFTYSVPSVNVPNVKLGDKLQITVTVTNTGKVAGEETAQMYIHEKVASVGWPVKTLKGFAKVFLKPGESRELTFDIGAEDLKFYNRDLNWVAEAGEFDVFIGGNSRDTQSTQFTMHL